MRENKPDYSSFSLIKRILTQGRAYWPHITGIFVLNLIAVPLALLVPVPLKIIVDSAFGDVPLPSALTFFFPNGFEFSFAVTILVAVCMLVLIEFLIYFHGFISWILQSYTGEKLVLSFRTLLFNQIQRLSLAYHDKTGVSDSLYRIQYDASSIRTLFVNGISSIITSGITVLGMLFIMTTIDWHFTVIALAIIPILIILVRSSKTKLKSHWFDVKKQESSAMSVVHETLSALRVVKAFSKEDHEEGRFVERSNNALKSQLKAAYTSGIFDLLIGVILAVGTALFLYQGSFFVQSGKITLGELLLVMTYLAQLFNPIKTIARNITSFQSAFVGLERAYTMLDKEKDIEESPGAIHVKKVMGAVRFENVSFEYVKGSPVLQNISFEIKAGQKVGIMGSTGSGKTTLINLLIRFYEPTNGQIIMDDLDIKKYRLVDYRSQFSIVLQEPVLFSTSIEENIAYGRPEATHSDIHDAATNAYADAFISRLPDKYQTEVGERGMQLSGGERQRISIARAFLKNAPVLVLDEPTSSVDVRTEQMIMNASLRLMENRTTFLITHRLDILSHCDVIIHLEKGKIIEIVQNDKTGILEDKISLFKQKAFQH
jgi:ATP-binding cassette, subfamily B, bacterial